jgi:outer membrane protein OmpA-like peptidoglycan-associated protein
MAFSSSGNISSMSPRWEAGRAARIALLVATLFSALATPIWASGPPAQKGKDAVIPVPERGLLYVRYGPPGGVKITSVRRPASVTAPAPAATMISRDRAELLASILREELDLMLRPISGLTVGGAARPLRTPESRAATQGPTVIVGQGVSTAASQTQASTVSETSGETEGRASPIPSTTVVADSGAPGASSAPGVPGPDLGEMTAEEAAAEAKTAGVLRTTRIRFAYDRADILPESDSALQTVAEVLRQNQDWRVLVEGHTDKRGNDCYNLGLSQRRAEAVRRFLIDRCGIAENRLKAIGFGETLPLIDEETDEAYAANRRVEFRLMD